jgi:gas vesicle protein
MDFNRKIIYSALIGAAAGAIAGLVLDSESGKTILKDAKNKAGELGDSLKDSFSNIAQKGREELGKITKKETEVERETEHA